MDNVNKEKREGDQDVLNKVSSAAARRQILCRIQRTLSLSLHVISRDHTQLPGQLLGRLMSFDDPWIGGLLAQAGETKAYTWLRPLSPFSSKAESPLEGIMSRHVSGVKGIVVEPDGQTVLSAARDGSIREWDLVDLKEKRKSLLSGQSLRYRTAGMFSPVLTTIP